MQELRLDCKVKLASSDRCEGGRRGQGGVAGADGSLSILWGIFALLSLAYLPALWSRGLWHIDELRYVEVAREMGTYGQALVPHLNGDVYAEKPPLFFWGIVLLERLCGSYVLSAKLLVWLAVGAAAMMCARLGRILLGGRRAGAIAALLFCSLAMTLDRGQRALIDPFLLAPTLLGTLALLEAALARGRRARVGATVLSSLALAAACLTKGPVGLALPVLGAIMAGWVAWGRGGVAWRSIVLALIFGAGITLLWLALAAGEAGEWYWDRMLWHQTLGRTVSSFAHRRPWHFYLGHAPALLLPWILLAPGALLLAWTGRRREGGARGALGAAAWCAAGLLLFSLVSGKRTGYLLPLMPAFAILIAFGLRRHEQGLVAPGLRRWFELPLLVSALAPAVVGVAVFVLLLGPAWFHAFAATRLHALVTQLSSASLALDCTAGAAMIGLSIWALRARAAVPLAPVGAICAAIAIGLGAAHATLMPVIEGQRSRAPFAQAVSKAVPGGERLVFLDTALDGRINLYTGVRHYEVVPAARLAAATQAAGDLWILAREPNWRALPAALRARFEIVLGPGSGAHGCLLLRERGV